MSKVVFVMLDGLRPDAIGMERTPALAELIRRGSSSLQARSVMPSITLPCHTSIFHSVPPSRHGIVTNDWQPMARPVRGLIEQLHLHQRSSAFFYNWEQLRDLSRPGHLAFSQFVDNATRMDGDDAILAAALPHLQAGAFDFTFVYFGTVDTAGHRHGWMSDAYLEQARRIDGLVARLVEAIGDDTHVIVQSDHGGHDRTHGTEAPEDMTIPWIIAGPGIEAGKVLPQAPCLLDTAPTIAHLLGVPAVPEWEGRVVTDAMPEFIRTSPVQAT